MKRTILFHCLLCLSMLVAGQNTPGLKLWYTTPAQKWSDEALPVGNGRMGAMLFGGVEKEMIQFNEQSLWSGDNNWDGKYETGDHGFGSYRNFGEIVIDFKDHGSPEGYSRSLDISNGIHLTSFNINGTKVIREAFASHPDNVMIFSYSAAKKGLFSGKISLSSAQGAPTTANANVLSFSGEMPNKLKYAAEIHIVNKGGTLKTDGNTIVFDGCSSMTVFVNARTNYKPDYKSGWRGDDPEMQMKKELQAALDKGFKKIRKDHLSDLGSLLSVASIDLGSTDPALLMLPTNERLKKYASGGNDPDLEELMFQYGRYLIASCSRPGGLPANLQGLWNNSNKPPWASDYHNNINIQMNYWLVESTSLPECHIPLIDFIAAQAEPCRIATRKAFGEKTRGWTARTSQNIFGGNGWEWNIPASAWYAQHLYEHWAFTRDETYLKETAYPLVKEICQYWEDNLKRLPDGTLVVPNGWSPEHGPREDGVMHDQQLVWDLFRNYLEMASALGVDDNYQKTIATMLSHLAPNKIGSWGQLQEWQEDRDKQDDQHRHTSHLFAVFPGRQISPATTPELAKAATISLLSRSGAYGMNKDKPFTVSSTIGDSRQSWAWPWRCAMWARLGVGDKAGIMVRGLLTYNTRPNLFTVAAGVFQMDGNFGISAAIAEMLLQSHAGQIELIPAIPAEWAKEGSYRGLSARGGFKVDCQWRDGKVVSYRIYSGNPGRVKVSVNGEVKEIIAEQQDW